MIFVVPQFRTRFSPISRPRCRRATEMLLTISYYFIANQYGWALIMGMPFGLFVLFKLMEQEQSRGKISRHHETEAAGPGNYFELDRRGAFYAHAGDAVVGGRANSGRIVHHARHGGQCESLMRMRLQKVHDAIREGESFAGPLRAAKVCDPIVTNMIDVGEETGDLDKMLMKIADNYDEEVDVLVGSLVSLLEPIMVVTLGGIVGTIVIALFLPLVEAGIQSGFGQ